LIFIGSLPMVTNDRPPLTFWSLLFLLGGAFIASRFLLKRKWPMSWIQITIMGCGLVAIFLVLRVEYAAGFSLFSGQWFATYGNQIISFFTKYPPFVFAIIAALYCWWRGISLSHSRLYFDDIYHSFLIQLTALVFLIIMWSFTYKSGPLKNITSNIGIYVVGFFFFGLLALALTNLRVIQEKFRKKGELSKNFSRRWLTTILIVIGGVILLGIGLASIFSSQFISLLGKFMNSISGAYSAVINFILEAIGLLVQLMYDIGEFLLSLIPKVKAPTTTPETSPLVSTTTTPGSGGVYYNPQLVLIIKLVFLALIIFGVIFLISRAIQRQHRKELTEDVEEEQESLWSWEGFKADLMVFFKAIFQLFKRKKKPAQSNITTDWHVEDDIERRLNIREIYQHLLWHGSLLKIPREKYETPSEYARRLGQVVPDGKEPLDEITGLYIDARYGDHPAEEKRTDRANSIWQKLRNLFKGREIG
jgi:Na+-transporting methylmalonyl-CoA/oxaloacetate decarboxylase gamma subunit